MSKFDSVAARFGGRDLTFKIARGDLAAFEVYAGQPAYTLFKTIAAGGWTVAQIRAVLRFATMTPATLKRMRHLAMVPGLPVPLSQLAKPTFVDEVLATNPPGGYAVLALNVLGAALFGIDEADAVFTDEATGGQE